MACHIIPFELPLQPALPTILGNVDYHDWRNQLLRINELLIRSDVETQFIHCAVQDWLAQSESAGAKVSAKAQLHYQERTRLALRCNIARSLLNEPFRDFAMRLADSPLLQSFCQISGLDQVKVPGKSNLERFSKWVPEAQVREIVAQLSRVGHQQPQLLNLDQALDLDACFVDTTCLVANIHYPVDWVLLRDATRTLMKAVSLIREQGLMHRMEEPWVFLRRINCLCIEMTHARGEGESKTKRKKILRKMDKVVASVQNHARRYRAMLDQDWEQTEWTRKQAEQVLRRIDNILEQLPAARKQARERIIKERLVDNAEKILSLYEPDVQVIVRRKAGAEVEFGNSLLLNESRTGVIVDWELFAESAPADSKLLIRSLERAEQALAHKIKVVGADRGFDSQSNQKKLEERKTYNGVCPRVPEQMKKRKGSWKFKQTQQRRSQTEGRIAIFKNNILGGTLLSKGFEHRQLAVAWAVLSHNLWVLARLPQPETAGAKAAA